MRITDDSVIALFKTFGHRTVAETDWAAHRYQQKMAQPDAGPCRTKAPHMRLSAVESRFGLSYTIEPTSKCWIWKRGVNSNGYARLTVNGRLTYAHRYSYEQAKGPIGDGLTIDHVCRNRRCVNPDHLEAVTFAENIRRAAPFRRPRIDGVAA